MMAKRGFPNIIVYLDDFLIISKSYSECLEAQHVLLSLLIKLGFLISWKKVLGPMCKLPFLGIMIDTTSCTLSLEEAKVSALKMKLTLFQEKSERVSVNCKFWQAHSIGHVKLSEEDGFFFDG